MVDGDLWTHSVKTTFGAYDIHVGNGLLFETDFPPLELSLKQTLIITISPLKFVAQELVKKLQAKTPTKVSLLIMPCSELRKTLDSAQFIWQYLLTHGYTRDTTLIALGGGALLDLVGFCAGCYHRGIDYISIPTTFLAQIDASIGGKTAVNLQGFKNIIGLFNPPKKVIIDISFLNSLPDIYYREGFSELLKYGLGFDATFFDWLEQNISELLNKNDKILFEAVIQAVSIKANIVSVDEYDKSLRAQLNLGHTLGHALEKLVREKTFSHGRAVSIGLDFALRLSESHLGLPSAVRNRFNQMQRYVGIPALIPKGISSAQILATIEKDKKHDPLCQRWILLARLGEAKIVKDIPNSLILKELALGKEALASDNNF